MAYQGFSTGVKGAWPWVLGFIAILFNPVATIHMTKEIWMAVDFVTGVLFSFLAYESYKHNKSLNS